MACSAYLKAKRAFVSVLLALGAAYGLTLGVNRDSDDLALRSAHRKLVVKTHPDKGGRCADQRKLQEAKEEFDNATKSSRSSGSSTKGSGSTQAVGVPTEIPKRTKREYSVHSTAVLLTYQGIHDQGQWRRFVEFVRERIRSWGVLRWCATLEASQTGRLHLHLYLQFSKQLKRVAKTFAFEGVVPNASSNNYLDESTKGKNFQQSLDRGFFYVFAEKEGTQYDAQGSACTEGNYQPVWTTAQQRYQVFGKWPQTLWQQRKLSHEKYEEYLLLARDGVQSRLRNLELVREREEQNDERAERERVTKAVKAELFTAFPPVPEAEAWLKTFRDMRSRYAFCVVVGASRSRKTEWAKSLFRNPLELSIGSLVHWPDKMRQFSRKLHDGLVLDDLRDCKWLVAQQEKLQGKYDTVLELGSSPTGKESYQKWLYRIPIVVTCNFTTENLELLLTDDFLGHPENRILLRREAPAGL